MKNFKIWATALLAVLGFASCSEDCDHDFIETDYSKKLVGTWTCFEGGYAEALVIKADGSVESTGVVDGKYWESKGTIRVVNNKMTYTLENGDGFEGRFEMIANDAFSMVVDEDLNISFTYRLCENDLSDELVGMWVCTQSKNNNYMIIQTFTEDNTGLSSGFSPEFGGYIVNGKDTYKVAGDLVFNQLPEDGLVEDGIPYIVGRLSYVPNGTQLGDLMNIQSYLPVGDEFALTSESYLRVKQDLNLVGKKYSYNNVYISNVKGSDKEINFMGYKFAFANMDGSRLEMVMKSALFGIEFPDANTVSYTYQLNGISETYTLPIVVEGNKMTFKVSEKVPSLKDVVFYAFQDADDSQMHLYIHQSSFVSFFTNMQAIMAAAVDPAFDITNPAAIDAIYNEIDAAVESINLSVVMK